ncbi:hypothetical protein FISHEDRAFT_55283 [Fistulina hepatica ATCC 64428]|uniref:Uncharacterized protein n=1 Tax=Fistulina hepatica ATCC 64428 TaxID=1128425 RepID=A0A0D7AN66_9AGAR|nr:hypothetical protein FISHEDRAFT_55283 [Fistulina hepatica ATCC 64428]
MSKRAPRRFLSDNTSSTEFPSEKKSTSEKEITPEYLAKLIFIGIGLGVGLQVGRYILRKSEKSNPISTIMPNMLSASLDDFQSEQLERILSEVYRIHLAERDNSQLRPDADNIAASEWDDFFHSKVEYLLALLNAVENTGSGDSRPADLYRFCFDVFKVLLQADADGDRSELMRMAFLVNIRMVDAIITTTHISWSFWNDKFGPHAEPLRRAWTKSMATAICNAIAFTFYSLPWEVMTSTAISERKADDKTQGT